MPHRTGRSSDSPTPRRTPRLLYAAHAAFLTVYLLLLLRPPALAAGMQAVDSLKHHVKKLEPTTVAVLVAAVVATGIGLSIRFRRWRAVILYLTTILLITPYLPRIVIATARMLGTTLRSLGSYIQVVTLLSMAGLLIFFLLRGGRFRQWRTYVALAAIALGSVFVIKKLSSAAVETVHIVEYGGLAIAAFSAFRQTARWTLPACYLLAWDVTIGMGILDELYQLVLPIRFCGLDDMLDNITSGLIGLAFVWGFLQPDRAAPAYARHDSERLPHGNPLR